MTAKEELEELLGSCTEDEADLWLERLRGPHGGRPLIRPGKLDGLSPEEQAQRLRALFDEWEAEGAYMTEEQWEEFARDFDAQRPHRPLFAQYLNEPRSSG